MANSERWNHEGEPGDPVAIETILGWTIFGKLSGLRDHHANVNLVLDATGEIADSELKRLWETKDVYENLIENIQFNGERYSVKLPWKAGHQTLLSNYQLCVNRLKGLKRRLDKDPEIAQEYNENIREQLKEGIIEKVAEDEPSEKIHYLLHHPVIRKTVETTS